MAWRRRMTAPKVLVRKRRWAMSRRNSNECFLGCSGYSSGLAGPNRPISFTESSTAWPLPIEATRTPLAHNEAPACMRASFSSGMTFRSMTSCRLLMVEPSLRAMKATFLLPRLLRTQPITVISLSEACICKACLYDGFYLLPNINNVQSNEKKRNH